jgi:hypothetical protein
MIGNSKESLETNPGGESAAASDSELILQPSVLMPGDVLLYRPRNPNILQQSISEATGGPYTHASIYLGDNIIAESRVPLGVIKTALKDSIQGNQCIAVLRSQYGFGGDRSRKLNEFVAAVLERRKFYNLIAVANFKKHSAEYFDNQLEFVRKNYGKVTSHEEFAEQSFFCSAFVVACYAVVGIIGENAQAAYKPNFFSPGHLYQDSTFGWLLGYLLPDGGSIPLHDPPLSQATLWRDLQEARWW